MQVQRAVAITQSILNQYSQQDSMCFFDQRLNCTCRAMLLDRSIPKRATVQFSLCWQRWMCVAKYHCAIHSGRTSSYCWSIRLRRDAILLATASNLLFSLSSIRTMPSRTCCKPSPKGLLCIRYSHVITSHWPGASRHFTLCPARHILRTQPLQNANHLTSSTQVLVDCNDTPAHLVS